MARNRPCITPKATNALIWRRCCRSYSAPSVSEPPPCAASLRAVLCGASQDILCNTPFSRNQDTMKPSMLAKLDQLTERLQELNDLLMQEDATANMDNYRKMTREHAELGP